MSIEESKLCVVHAAGILTKTNAIYSNYCAKITDLRLYIDDLIQEDDIKNKEFFMDLSIYLSTEREKLFIDVGNRSTEIDAIKEELKNNITSIKNSAHKNKKDMLKTTTKCLEICMLVDDELDRVFINIWKVSRLSKTIEDYVNKKN